MKTITVQFFKKILDLEKNNSSIAFINVCTPIEYAEKHIEGVGNIPLDTLEENLESLRNKQTIYVHCMSGKRAEKAIEKMHSAGITAEIINVTGGLNAWQEAGFSIGSLQIGKKLPIMRQVFLSAGILILLGVIGFVSTGKAAFIILPGFVGMGLTFSGLTGWCGLQLVLSKMPWNKTSHC